MKKIPTILIFIAIAFHGCKTEGDIGPSRDETFIKYIGSENNNVAVLAEEVDNGFTLLSYSEVATSTVGRVIYKTKLTRTDRFGNVLWDRNYPEFIPNSDAEESMKPSTFIKFDYKLESGETENGYLILADGINANGVDTELKLLQVDSEGILHDIKTILPDPADLPHLNGLNGKLEGKSLTRDWTSHLMVLATIRGESSNEMCLLRLDASSKEVVSGKRYGQGGANVIPRLYKTLANPNYTWGGSVKLQNSQSSAFFIEVDSIGDPTYNNQLNPDEVELTSKDFCKTVGGWALTGSFVNESGNTDIFIKKISSLGVVVSLHFADSRDFEQQNDVGVSICAKSDGALIVGGTVGTTKKAEDLYIAKWDGVGNKLWEQTYGNSDKQEAASVRSVSSGGYILFGTTYFGNVKKLVLVRVDEEGRL